MNKTKIGIAIFLIVLLSAFAIAETYALVNPSYTTASFYQKPICSINSDIFKFSRVFSWK
jgi:hypothetical protein